VTPVAFAVDTMLRRLGRWLRILGHDVAYGPHLRGRGLVARARRDGRVILTRDTRLVRDPNLPPHVFIAGNHLRDQLRQVATAVPLVRGARYSRCVECNVPLVAIAREAVRGRVPPSVFERQERFSTCASCRRIFWAASHHTRMDAELAALGLEAPA
jgi:uncharacterized protein with PIN domain